MTKEKKYAVFVLTISLCYTALPHVFTAVSGTERNAVKTVTIMLLGLVAELFYVFYLDILLIVIPLTYLLIKTKINANKLNINILLLLVIFFSTIYYGNLVSFNRFSEDLTSGYQDHSDIRKWHITKTYDHSFVNFAAYTYYMPVTYFSKMDKHSRDKVFFYLPGLATRVLVSILLTVMLLAVFIYISIATKKTRSHDLIR